MKKVLRKRITAFVMALCMITGMVFSDVPAFSMQVQAEETKTYLSVGESKTWDFKDSSFGVYSDTDGTYTTDDGILTVTGTGSCNTDHGFTTSVETVFSVNVPAGSVKVLLPCCAYNNSRMAELQVGGVTVSEAQDMVGNTKDEAGKACGTELVFTYTATEATTLDIVLKGTSQVYVPKLTVIVEAPKSYMSVGETVEWNLADSGFGVYNDTDGSYTTDDGILTITGTGAYNGHGFTTKNGTVFSVNVPAGSVKVSLGCCKYNNAVTAELQVNGEVVSAAQSMQGNDSLAEGKACGDEVTLTYTATEAVTLDIVLGGSGQVYVPHLKVTAEAPKTYMSVGETVEWNLADSGFGVYNDTDGSYTTDDGILTITGTGSYNGHGFTTKNGTVFSVNVPAGSVKVSLGCCKYNNAVTAELQVNGEVVSAAQSMQGNDSLAEGKACGDEVTLAYTATEAVTLDIVLGGSGQVYVPHLKVTAEAPKTYMSVGETVEWNLADSGFGVYNDTDGSYTTDDGILTITGTGSYNSHGFTTKNGTVFSVNVPAGSVKVSLGCCKYNNAVTAELQVNGEVVSAAQSMQGNDSLAEGKACGDEVTLTYTATEAVTLDIVLGGSGQVYVPHLKVTAEEKASTATVSGSVSADLNGENLIFSSNGATKAVAIENGAYSVELSVGSAYTVSFEKGLYRVLTGGSVDLTNTEVGATVTNDITYEEVENRLVLDAPEVTWDFRNGSFGAYGKSEWYSGNGLVVEGTLSHNGAQHGADISTANVFTVNVPAGQTTVTVGVCSYGSATATATCNGVSQEITLHGDGKGGDNDGLPTSIIFTNNNPASIVITITAGGYLHTIKAKTETVQPLATVSGTVDSAVNGQVLNFKKDGATVASATIANGAYTVELPINSVYTVEFENSAVYEVVEGGTVDFSEVSEGESVTNNITYSAWDAGKSFSITLGDTVFSVTPGASKEAAFTVVASGGTGSVELSAAEKALLWTNLEGLGGGVLSSSMIKNVSSNVTTSFSGNTLTVTYVDKTTNPISYEMLVKDNSATGEAVADGTPLSYNFIDGSIVSPLYDGSKYVLSGGKTISSADGLVTLTGNKKIYYNGSHGIVLNQNDTISVNVAGDATISFATCEYTNSGTASTLTCETNGKGSVTASSNSFTGATDGAIVTYEYVGEETTLVFKYTSSGTAYLHSMSVKNHVSASDVDNQQSVMPQIMTYGTASSLTAIPVGQRYIFTQTGGQMNTDTQNGCINTSVSYFGFPATAEKYKLEADVVLSECGASNYNGIYFGAFDEDYIATIAIRNSTGLRGILSKSSADMAGASTVDAVIERGETVHYTVEKTEACFVITATLEDGTEHTMEFDYNDSGVLLFKEAGVDASVSYGFAIAGSSAIITNMKYYDANGNIVYDQNDCYEPVGTAPIVSSISSQAAYSREYISVNWTSSVAVVGDGRYVLQVSKDGSAYTTITETTDTAFDYSISEAGEYIFRAAGKLGEDGEPNTWVYSEPLEVIAALTKPVVSISSTASNISISWDAVDNALRYEVYRYSFDEGASNQQKIASITGTSYTDSNIVAEMPYYYSVVALSADNYSNPSVEVWAVASAGHAGDYVYEDDAAEIVITKKSYDTVFNGKAVLEGRVMGNGTMKATVNGTVASQQALSANDTFSMELSLAEGRNDVVLYFTDASGNTTRKTYNFVYLTNYDIVVDAEYIGTEGAQVNGIPTYSTVQAAVDSVSGSERTVIFVAAGSYEERLVVNTPNISIVGEDREATLIHCYPGDLGSEYEAGEDMTKRCATYVQSIATGFSAENISFANDYVYATPDGKSNKSADAFRCDADAATFVNVKFSGVQDTLYMHSGKQYYYRCMIEGLVDFIYSGDAARSFFNDCEIVFVYESTKKGGYVCAPKTAIDATYGLTFSNCVITAEEGCAGNGYLLARPWGPNAYITWINCYMGKVVNKNTPYDDMSGNAYTDARFFEFGSYGPGYLINSERRQISQTKAELMISDNFLGWSPKTVSAAIAADYEGDIVTDRNSGSVEDEYVGSDKYLWTDGNDTGLAKYNQEGYAESYGVTGGGLLLETSENYYQVDTAEEFLAALRAVKESGKGSVIELTADINLGCNEIENFNAYSDIIKPYSAQPLTHPTLLQSGVSVLALEDMYNFTIFSKNGASIKHANITMKNAGNIIIRNIKFDELWEWDEETEGNYDRNDWDFMTIDSACDGIWVDHCTFYKAYDGVVDMKNPAPEMNVTISWCEFLPGSEDDVFFDVMMDELAQNAEDYPYYSHLLEAGMTAEQVYAYAHGQKKTHLLGQDDKYTNAAGINATFANNVYKDSMDRMPRVRYGTAHVYNCIMDAQNLLTTRLSIADETLAAKIVSNGAASTCGAQVLLQNCYISGIQNALNSGNGSSPSGYINATGSVYYMNGVKTALTPKANSTTDSRVLITDANAFVSDLPYSDYILCNAETLNQYVTPYAGAGKLALTVLQWEKASYNDASAVVTPVPPTSGDSSDDDDDDDNDNTNNGNNVVEETVTVPKKEPVASNATQKVPQEEVSFVINENMDWRTVNAAITSREDSTEGFVLGIQLGAHYDIPASIFDEIKGEDIVLNVYQDNGAMWSIDGTEITRAHDVSLKVTLDSEAIRSEELHVFEQYKARQMSLEHNGNFGFKASLSVPMEQKDEGKYANLFYYNNGAFEFQESCKIDAGYATFTFTHASDYVIVISEEAVREVPTIEDEKEDVKDVVENTTDSSNVEEDKENIPEEEITAENNSVAIVIIIVVVMVAIIAGVLVVRNRKKYTDQ